MHHCWLLLFVEVHQSLMKIGRRQKCDISLLSGATSVIGSDAYGEDIDSLTHCLTDYINFCVENTVPTRTVRSFSNCKPWITPDIKALLKEKRRAFCVWKQRGAEVCAEGAEEDDQEGGKTATGGRWSTSCSRTTSVVSGRELKTIPGFKEPKS
ncbi:hypothetical protein L3Q82_001219 [Scortum barcoo]|uniref:Uncharacterized protein n=1 Tax=Scortum barcoo TaxID=214431 RepID=A0ACB8W8U5_9TELE|nr:hypothetical protein L3Q82_001219 [Scortum barcoo]